MQAADEAGAKGLNDTVKQAAAQLQAMSMLMQQRGPQGATMSQAIGALAAALQPTQAGSKVTLSIDGKTVGPAIVNLLPMMGAAQGGPGGPPTRGGL